MSENAAFPVALLMCAAAFVIVIGGLDAEPVDLTPDKSFAANPDGCPKDYDTTPVYSSNSADVGQSWVSVETDRPNDKENGSVMLNISDAPSEIKEVMVYNVANEMLFDTSVEAGDLYRLYMKDWLEIRDIYLCTKPA